MEKKYLSKDIVGKQVIDSKANIVGNVKDMSFDMSSKDIALIVATKAGGEITINGSNITIIGDVVLLNKTVESLTPTPPTTVFSVPEKPQTAPQPSATPGLCGSCGYQNDANSNFCIKCGAKLK